MQPVDGRRASRSSSGRRPWQFSLWSLFVLTTICAVLLSLFEVSKRFPLQSLILAAVFAIAAIGVVLYIGELVVIGWIVDFLSAIGMPRFQPRAIPLEYESVGDIIIVTLRENIATAGQCQSVERDLKRLIHEHHCNIVLDFHYAGRISRSFRGVMICVRKAADREAKRLGKSARPLALPRGEEFSVFVDRQRAVEEMTRKGGHGWVVLCSVPVGIRAVFG